MSWPVKISFRPNPDKELNKEIKFEPKLTILSLLLKACEIFEIKDKHNYNLMHKKTILQPFDSLIESKLAQGSTVTLFKTIRPCESRDVLFNYKIINNSSIIKSLGRYHSDELFCDCFKNIPLDSKHLNSLEHPSKLPLISILSAKLYAEDIMNISEFTLDSLGLKGNYSVMVNYYESNDRSKFVEFLSAPCNIKPKHEITPIISNSKLPPKVELIDSLNNDLFMSSRSKSFENDVIKFRIFRPSEKPTDTPDVPDSFYELTSNELLEFQKSLQKTTKSLVDRPLLSAKSRTQQTCSIRDSVNIKLIFPDQIQVLANFQSNSLTNEIVNFINSRIFQSPRNNIELWIGPPYARLKDFDKTLNESGIIGSTRIIVKCDQYVYRQDLKFEKI